MSSVLIWGVIAILILSAFAYYFVQGALMPKKTKMNTPSSIEHEETCSVVQHL